MASRTTGRHRYARGPITEDMKNALTGATYAALIAQRDAAHDH